VIAPVNTPSPVITIDGPAASGKSSVARLVAERLGYTYVNTGNMYRAMTWAVLDAGIDPASDPASVATFSASAPIDCTVTDGQTTITIAGHLLTAEELNSDPVNRAVSHVAAVLEVRNALVAAQRALQSIGPLVMEGRDIGSVVFPESPFKYYIDASEEVRSARRRAQGHADQVAERDRIDSTRKASPLIIPNGATVIDNSHLTLDQAVESVLTSLKSQGLPTP
jgi:cytidylate kinase